MAHMNVKVFNDEWEQSSLIIPYNVALVTPHDLNANILNSHPSGSIDNNLKTPSRQIKLQTSSFCYNFDIPCNCSFMKTFTLPYALFCIYFFNC